MYREREFEEGIRLEWNDLAARWRNEKFYGLIFPRLVGQVAELQKELQAILKASYIFFSCVKLDEVIKITHKLAYPLRQEVKGLTRERHQAIIDNLQAPPLDEEGASTVSDEVPAEPPLNVIPVADVPAKNELRRLPVSALLNVIKAEADTYGLDKKYYVSTDRTIRNWLKGTSTPPPGFSVEVLSNLESIAEFAHKYIEAVVAAGSSELAANAKKEVAFNSQLHGLKLETSDDAELMMEALKDASKHLSAGNRPEAKRKRRPF
jgi:hypothetical protein